MQSKVYYKLFYLKKASLKALKVEAAKKFFASVFIIDTTCLDECFLFYLITNWKQYFLHKSIVTQRLGATIMLLRSLKLVF